MKEREEKTKERKIERKRKFKWMKKEKERKEEKKKTKERKITRKRYIEWMKKGKRKLVKKDKGRKKKEKKGWIQQIICPQSFSAWHTNSHVRLAFINAKNLSTLSWSLNSWRLFILHLPRFSPKILAFCFIIPLLYIYWFLWLRFFNVMQTWTNSMKKSSKLQYLLLTSILAECLLPLKEEESIIVERFHFLCECLLCILQAYNL